MQITVVRSLAALMWLSASWPTLAMNTEAIDELLARAVQQGRVAGVVAMAADADKILYAGAFGLADVAAEKPMRLDSIFRIASMTKPITSLAVMQMVEAEQIALSEPIATYLPDLGNKLRLLEVNDNRGVFERPSEQPTVAQLLSHTSGLGYEIWNPVLNEGARAGLFSGMTASGQGYLRAPLVYEPGHRWNYSISTDVLGHLVETLRGVTLEAYFQANILEPLEMVDTSFLVPAERQERVATLHARAPGEPLTEQANEGFPIPEHFSGGGGLYSTAPDYVRFMQMILRDGQLGNRVLQPASIAAMASNQIGNLEMVRMTTYWPGLSNSFHLFPEAVGRFGFGFALNERAIPGRRRAGSLAWAGLYNTYFWIDRTSNRCGVLLAQILPFYDAEVVALLDEFEHAVYQQ